MEPPKSFVVPLQLCAEGGLWLLPGSDLLDVRAVPSFSSVV